MTLRPKTPRRLDSWIDLLRKRVPDVSFQDLRHAIHETVASCPHKSGAAKLWTDTTSVSLALDDRSLLFGATGASHVRGKPSISGISRVYRCVLPASRSSNESCRIGKRHGQSVGLLQLNGWHRLVKH